MQGKFTKKRLTSSKIFLHIIICPRVRNLLQPKCPVLCSTFSSHLKRLLCSQRYYMQIHTASVATWNCEYIQICVNIRINVYIYYNVMCICIVLTVNIMPCWWATTQSSQLWSLVPPKALPCSSWPAIWPWLSMWTPGETVPYAHLIRYDVQRSCDHCEKLFHLLVWLKYDRPDAALIKWRPR